MVTRAVRPSTDDSNVEDPLDQVLRADLWASAAPGRAHEKNAEGERVKKAADVGVGKDIRKEGGGGEATEESPGRAREEISACVCFHPCLRLLNV